MNGKLLKEVGILVILLVASVLIIMPLIPFFVNPYQYLQEIIQSHYVVSKILVSCLFIIFLLSIVSIISSITNIYKISKKRREKIIAQKNNLLRFLKPTKLKLIYSFLISLYSFGWLCPECICAIPEGCPAPPIHMRFFRAVLYPLFNNKDPKFWLYLLYHYILLCLIIFYFYLLWIITKTTIQKFKH